MTAYIKKHRWGFMIFGLILLVLVPLVVLAGDVLWQGADNVSNTKSGPVTYPRLTCYDGTTWDMSWCTLGSIHVLPNSNIVDDAAFTPATDYVDMIGCEFDDTAPDSVNEGDGGAVRMSANRNMYITIRDAAGNERGTNVNASSELNVFETSSLTDDAAFTPATDQVNMCGYEFDDTAPDSVDEGDGGAARMSANRSVYMNIRDAAGNERGVNVTAANDLEIDMVTVAGTATNVNGGNRDAGTQTVTLADNDPAVTSLATIDNTIVVDDAAFTPATTSVNMCGFEYDDTAPDSVDEGDAGAVRMSANRNAYVQLRDDTTEISADVATAGADDAANTDNGLVTYARLGAYDGAKWDRLTVNANGYLQVTDAEARPGEDSGNDWVKVKKEDTANSTPAKTTTATIGTATVEILADIDVSQFPNWCIYIENTDGADPFTDLDIEVSPDETLYIELVQTVCPDTLAAGAACVFCCSQCAHRYVHVDAAAADANQASSDVWFVANKG